MLDEIDDPVLELQLTAQGMRNAGAERNAVVQLLREAGLSDAAANEMVDRIDADSALRHGARHGDMKPEIARQAEVERARRVEANSVPKEPEDFWPAAAQSHSDGGDARRAYNKKIGLFELFAGIAGCLVAVILIKQGYQGERFERSPIYLAGVSVVALVKGLADLAKP